MKARQYTQLALIFSVIQMLVIVRNVEFGFFGYFWYCDAIPGLLVVACLWHNVQAIKGFVSVGLFVQVASIGIVLAKLAGIEGFFGLEFEFPSTARYLIPTLVIHTSTVLALVATRKERLEPVAMWYALGVLILLYATALILARSVYEVDTDYNFAFGSDVFSWFPLYTEFWIPLAFIFVVVPTHFIQLVISERYNRHLGATGST